MTENLDLDIDSNGTYTTQNTDLAYAKQEDIDQCLKRGESCKDEDEKYKWVPDKSTYSMNNTTWNNTRADSVTDEEKGDFIAQSYDPGDKCWKAEIIWPTGSNHPEDIRECEQHDNSHYHLGNYYSYGAAVAQNDTSSKTIARDYYDTSICPAGWQLPTEKGDKSFVGLNNAGANWTITTDIKGQSPILCKHPIGANRAKISKGAEGSRSLRRHISGEGAVCQGPAGSVRHPVRKVHS